MEKNKADFSQSMIDNTAYAEQMFDEVINQRKNFNFTNTKNIKHSTKD